MYIVCHQLTVSSFTMKDGQDFTNEMKAHYAEKVTAPVPEVDVYVSIPVPPVDSDGPTRTRGGGRLICYLPRSLASDHASRAIRNIVPTPNRDISAISVLITFLLYVAHNPLATMYHLVLLSNAQDDFMPPLFTPSISSPRTSRSSPYSSHSPTVSVLLRMS